MFREVKVFHLPLKETIASEYSSSPLQGIICGIIKKEEWGESRSGGLGGEMAQTMYAHTNKLIKKKRGMACYYVYFIF
jgi:hypothetical protein